jgi:hypothetical protein
VALAAAHLESQQRTPRSRSFGEARRSILPIPKMLELMGKIQSARRTIEEPSKR